MPSCKGIVLDVHDPIEYLLGNFLPRVPQAAETEALGISIQMGFGHGLLCGGSKLQSSEEICPVQTVLRHS